MKHIVWGLGLGLVGIAALALGVEDPPIDADSPQLAKLAAETAQLRARLGHVEQQLRQQQQQHEQIEAMLRQTVEATASRLESLLGESKAAAPMGSAGMSAEARVGTDAAPAAAKTAAKPELVLGAPPSDAGRSASGTGTAAPVATPAETPAQTTAAPNAQPVAVAPVAPTRTEASAIDRSMVPPHRRPWLWLLFGSGACALAALAWRWIRPQSTGIAPTRSTNAADPAQVVVDAGTEALWATAHELGEPEGSAATATSVGASAAPLAVAANSEQLPAPRGAVPLGGAARITAVPARERAADEVAEPVPLAAPAAQSPLSPAERTLPRISSADGPTRLSLVVPNAHPDARAAVELRLQIDPRVLKQPPPRVRLVQGRLEIDCALIPGLPPGDLAHVRAVLQQTAVQN